MNNFLIEWILLATAALALAAAVVFLVRDRFGGRQEFRPAQRKNGNGGEDTVPEWNETLSARLRSAGLPSNPALSLLFVLVLPSASALAVLHLMDFALSPALFAFTLTIYLLCNVNREWCRYRSLRFEEKLADSIDLMAGALRGGESFTQAMESTAAASERVVRRQLEEIVRRLALGMHIRRAVTGLLDRYDCESVRLFVNTLAAKWEAGGDLAPVLTTVSRMTRERFRYRLRTHALTAGAWTTSILTALLPYVLVVVFRIFFPDWLSSLLGHPYGPGLIFLAVCLQVVGFTWLHRLMRKEIW